MRFFRRAFPLFIMLACMAVILYEVFPETEEPVVESEEEQSDLDVMADHLTGRWAVRKGEEMKNEMRKAVNLREGQIRETLRR